MPSTRLEARNQARAIPLVTVSLARSHMRQARASNSSRTTDNGPQQILGQRGSEQENDQPPPYEQSPSSSSNHSGDPLPTSNNSHHNATRQLTRRTSASTNRTEAVLNLSRTLVSASKPVPQKPPTSSWLFMVIYSWTHTHRAATKLYHILTHPGTLLKEIQGQSAHSQEQKKQLKSIQQQTEEQDQMEDDPDMLDSTATEMVPVSMLNARTVASMEESLPVDDGMQDGVDDSSDDSITPGQPRRKIDRYRNPFSPTVSSTGEQEDDEGWLGAGEECSEYGETKSNSVRMSSPKTSRSDRRRIPDFSTPSLGPAMDPSQFKDMADNNIPTGSRLSSLSASSVFNTPRLSRSSSPLLRTSNSATSSHETIPAATLTAGVQQHGPSPPSLPHQGLSKVSTNDSLQRDSEPEQLPAPAMADSLWTEQSHIREEYYAPSMSDVSGMVTSTTASFTDISSVAFSESSGHSIPSFTSIPSFDEVIS